MCPEKCAFVMLSFLSKLSPFCTENPLLPKVRGEVNWLHSHEEHAFTCGRCRLHILWSEAHSEVGQGLCCVYMFVVLSLCGFSVYRKFPVGEVGWWVWAALLCSRFLADFCITGSIMVYIFADVGNSCPHILFFLFPSFFLYLNISLKFEFEGIE